MSISVNVLLLPAAAQYSPKRVSPRFCCAYTTYFEDCRLSFPIPEILLFVLIRVRLAFPQMGPGLVPYMIGLIVRTREEGINFNLKLIISLCSIKHNSTAAHPRTFYVILHSGWCITEGLLLRNPFWQEKYFFFNVGPASIGYFAFDRLSSV